MENVLILMATYNGEKYLQQQLDSLYAQTNINVKILVRDDGSNDMTLDVLKENARCHNLEWYQGEHKSVQKGFFELMEKAFLADYEFYAFCDQDDVWDPDKLDKAVKNIGRTKVPTLYYTGQRLVDENLNFIEDHRLNEKRSVKSRFVFSDFAGCTGVFNRALLEEVVKYEPEYMLMHDTWILRVCLCLGGKIIINPEPSICYRQHANNTLGLGHGFQATIKQVKQYMDEYQIQRVTQELIKGYGNRMTDEYKQLSEWIVNYKGSSSYRKKLLDRKNIDFCKFGLNIVYELKVRGRKL